MSLSLSLCGFRVRGRILVEQQWWCSDYDDADDAIARNEDDETIQIELCATLFVVRHAHMRFDETKRARHWRRRRRCHCHCSLIVHLPQCCNRKQRAPKIPHRNAHAARKTTRTQSDACVLVDSRRLRLWLLSSSFGCCICEEEKLFVVESYLAQKRTERIDSDDFLGTTYY